MIYRNINKNKTTIKSELMINDIKLSNLYITFNLKLTVSVKNHICLFI